MCKSYYNGISIGLEIAQFFAHTCKGEIADVFPEYVFGNDIMDFARLIGYDEVCSRIENYYAKKHEFHVGDIALVFTSNKQRALLVTQVKKDSKGNDLVNGIFKDGDTGCYNAQDMTKVTTSQNVKDWFASVLPSLYEFLKAVEMGDDADV